MTFQTFPEGGSSSAGPRILHGTIDHRWPELAWLNGAGHGVFAMVNAGDGLGRSGKNVIAVRAVFTDDDGQGSSPAPDTKAAPPSMVVSSKRGPQNYWVLRTGEPLEGFGSAQASLAARFGTDPKVKDLPRVMRLPGFFHLKDRAHPYLVTVQQVLLVRYSVEEVLAAFLCNPIEGPAPKASSPAILRPRKAEPIARRGGAEFWMAVIQYNRDHARQYPRSGGTCPACGHSGCFGTAPGGGARWSCFSAHHSEVGVEGSGCFTGDALDLAALEARKSRRELLRDEGYLVDAREDARRRADEVERRVRGCRAGLTPPRHSGTGLHAGETDGGVR
jgi:hypothetical protein